MSEDRQRSLLSRVRNVLGGGLSRWWLASLVVFLVAYSVVNVLYAASTVPPAEPEINAPDRLVIYLNPIGVSPAEDLIKTRFSADPPDDLVADNGLRQDLEIHLFSAGRTFAFKAGTKQLTGEVGFIAGNDTYELYPFDRYSDTVVAFATTKDASGQEVALPTEIVVWGKFSGWRVVPATSQDERAARGDTVNGQTPPDTMAVVTMTAARNGSTMTIVVLVIASMIVLTALALAVARAVATRRRKIEATMASWFAALLFAMVPLRTNLPGAPPIGVYLDFLAFLWVLIGLMIALGIFITSWLRYTPPPEARAAQPEAAAGTPPQGSGTDDGSRAP